MFSALFPYISNRVYHAANEIKLKGWFQWTDLKGSTEQLAGFGVILLSMDNDVDFYIDTRKRVRYDILGYYGTLQ